MKRVGGISANLRLPWWSLAGAAFVAALGAGGWIAVRGAEGGVSLAAIAVPFLLLLLAGAAGAAGLEARVAVERQRLGGALGEARRRLQCLDEVLDVWQWRTDSAHRLVELRPPAGAAATDWRPPDGGATLWDVFRTGDDAALQSRMAGGARLDDIEIGRPTSDPSWRGLLRGRPHRDAFGEFAGYQGVVREVPIVTAAVPAPEPTSVTADAAGEQESFSYTVSHDLRAPIRVVEGFTRIVKEDYGRLLDRVGNDHLDRVLGAAARMNNMIDALLALSRLASQPLARQPVNLSQLAGYVADELRRQSPERSVVLSIEPGLRAQGDPTLLRVVIENLLGNAWKYTAKSSRAEIHLERHHTLPDTFTVRDNGAGFDMRFADRLFGVFQRLHSANDFAGTGIGLASVRRIVRRHGGEIWGEAEVNRGARFHFSLPSAQDTPAPTPRRPASASSTMAPSAPAAAARTPLPSAPHLPPAAFDAAPTVGQMRAHLAGAPVSTASSSRSA